MNSPDRKDLLLAKARHIVEAAQDAGRAELTKDEQRTVDGILDEVRRINAAPKSDGPMEQLDQLAREAYGTATESSVRYLAMTGHHQKALAERIIAAIPRDPMTGQKALVSGGSQTVSDILAPGIIATGRPALSILDLLPTRVVSPSYLYLRQNTRSLAAAPVASGGTKPTSDVGVQSVANRLRVVATVSNALDRFVLEDNSALSAFVTDELVYGVRLALETEVISGDGTGEHFTGILNSPGLIVQAFLTSALVSIRHALATLDATGYEASAIVLRTADWRDLELLLTSSGATDVRGLPIDSVSRKLWGVPVALSDGLPVKTGLVIGAGAVTVDTDGKLEAKWFDSVASDVITNQVRCRVETRAGVSVMQPAAVVKVGTAA